MDLRCGRLGEVEEPRAPCMTAVRVEVPDRAQVRIFDATTQRERAVEGVAVSPDSRWAFVTRQGRNRLAIIDIERGAIVAMAPPGTWSAGGSRVAALTLAAGEYCMQIGTHDSELT